MVLWELIFSSSFQVHQLGDKVLFFVEEHRAAQELKNVGNLPSKGGPLTIIVKPSGPPKNKGGHDSSRGRGGSSRGGSSRGGSSRGGSRFTYEGRRKGDDDDDISMDEDPTQVLTVRGRGRECSPWEEVTLILTFHGQFLIIFFLANL